MSISGIPLSAAPRTSKQDTTAWKAIVLQYQEPSLWRASWQIVNTLGTYAALWVLMYFSLAWSPWITAALAVVAGL